LDVGVRPTARPADINYGLETGAGLEIEYLDSAELEVTRKGPRNLIASAPEESPQMERAHDGRDDHRPGTDAECRCYEHRAIEPGPFRHLCFGSSTGRSGSERLGAPAATKQKWRWRRGRPLSVRM
jgi:hypothetical protein